MLSQTTEDKQLINVSATRPKSEGPFHSNLEKHHELKKKQDKLHLQWPLSRRHNGLSTIHWAFINMDSNPRPTILLLSGLPLPWKTPGTRSSLLKTSQPHTRFPPLCPNVGNCMRTLHLCSNLRLLWWQTKYRTLR